MAEPADGPGRAGCGDDEIADDERLDRDIAARRQDMRAGAKAGDRRSGRQVIVRSVIIAGCRSGVETAAIGRLVDDTAEGGGVLARKIHDEIIVGTKVRHADIVGAVFIVAESADVPTAAADSAQSVHAVDRQRRRQYLIVCEVDRELTGNGVGIAGVGPVPGTARLAKESVYVVMSTIRGGIKLLFQR